MRHYETVFIADPDLSPDVHQNLFEKARNLISGNAGELIDFDEWGNKRLAYEIRKKQRGHYVRLDYCGSGATVSSLENALRIDERVLKFMTVLVDPESDPEQLKAALEASRQPAKPAADEGEKVAAAEANEDTGGDDREAPAEGENNDQDNA
ncbi:MAG: 30S ribosomal protein S6 [Thermodesulfobacteriota bacterium]